MRTGRRRKERRTKRKLENVWNKKEKLDDLCYDMTMYYALLWFSLLSSGIFGSMGSPFVMDTVRPQYPSSCSPLDLDAIALSCATASSSDRPLCIRPLTRFLSFGFFIILLARLLSYFPCLIIFFQSFLCALILHCSSAHFVHILISRPFLRVYSLSYIETNNQSFKTSFFVLLSPHLPV